MPLVICDPLIFKNDLSLMDRVQRGAASVSRCGSIETSPQNTSGKRAPHTFSDVDGKASNLLNLVSKYFIC